MTPLPIYYLDTTIQLSKLFAPQPTRANIQHRITQQRCVVSRYVRMEYLRWLEPCVHLDQLLKEEAERNHATAISEVQARILLQYGRQQNKLLSILTWLVRYHNSQDTHGVLASLKNLIENNLHLFFAENVEELPDPIACPLMDLKGVPHGTSYRLEPDMPYRRGEMPCHIVDFLQKHRGALQELAPALNEAYPKIADACRRVLANPADAQGNLCKTLGDVIIALQTPTAAVLWSTDAAYDVICPTLGIAHVREPITTQTS